MSRNRPLVLWTLAGLLALVAGNTSAADDVPAPTRVVYPHESFRREELGAGPRSYWLFEPTEPVPETAPVVVFHHGWLAVNPGIYGAWIQHLCRRGFVVVFPRYHADWTTSPAEYLPNTVAAIRDAIQVLKRAPGRVRPDLERFALIGHSAGGNLSALVAASAAEAGLPRPRAVVAVMPGEVRPVASPSLSRIPAETLLVVVAGDLDLVVGDARARAIHAEATSVPSERKLYVLYRSDRRGAVSLLADHLAPTAPLPALDTGEGPFRGLQMGLGGVDVLDLYGFWRLADLTLDAAFSGRTLFEATAAGAAFRDLGRWSDGRPVARPVVGNDLAAIPRLIPSHGVRLVSWDPNAYVVELFDRSRR